MKQWIRSVVEQARESLFVVPGVAILAAPLVAWATLALDDLADAPIPALSVTAAAGRTILGTIAGATMTVAGIVFAMTAVTIQLASSAYSPRVIRRFLRDRFQQRVIAAAAGTFTFCLVAMGALRTPGLGDESVAEPSVSVTLGIVLGVITLAAIVAFIDHIVGEMRSDRIIGRITQSTVDAIRGNLPESPETEPVDGHPMPTHASVPVVAWRTGWVRVLDAERIVDALPPGAVLRLDAVVGSYVTSDFVIGELWAAEDEVEAVTLRIRDATAIGAIRSIDRDPMYGLRLMVDIALKALSPGINDPSTAVAAVLHLARPLAEVMRRGNQPSVVRGPDGRRLFLTAMAGRADYLRVAFREIRLFAGDQPEVLEAMIDVLGGLVTELERRDLGGRTEMVREQGRLVVEASQALPTVDRERIAALAVERGLVDG